jgi:hypothetical protein
MDAKSKHSRDVRGIGGKGIRHQIIERHQKQMGECGPKGCSVDGSPSPAGGGVMSAGARADRWGLVDALAFGAENFDGVYSDFVFEAHG